MGYPLGMAYLHVLREAARLLDDGATYSHRGALGHVAGTKVAVRLVYRGGSADPWWTRVEVALPRGAPLELAIEEVDGPSAERVRATFASDEEGTGGMNMLRFLQDYEVARADALEQMYAMASGIMT